MMNQGQGMPGMNQCQGMPSGCGGFGPGSHNDNGRNGPFEDGFFGHPGDWMLLVDNATRDNFDNMTLAEIQTLKEEKTQELQNMTLGEINELRQQKMDEFKDANQENMRLGPNNGNGNMGRGGCR